MAKPAALLLLALLLAAPALAGEGEEAKATPRERFREARRVLLSGDAATAAELFRTIAAADPASDVADDALYWLGRASLRRPDREPDAVVAFLRVIREHPESPFVDDAARELALLGDRTVVPELERRRDAGGAGAEMAVRALSELAREAGADAAGDDLAELRREVERLRKEVEEAIALLVGLLEERKSGAKGAGEEGR